MKWANSFIERLKLGETVQFRPKGGSMSGKIESGQLVTVEPVTPELLYIGAIVLCEVNGSQYLHIVKDIKNGRFTIGNNKGRINGTIDYKSIYGICKKIED